jgi:predicted DNA-binding transcriptional regulator YafY
VIHYKKFDHEKGKEHTFYPYLLKEYRFRWYLLGYSEKRRGKLILALDRMENITPIKIAFKPYKGRDIQKYFDQIIGVSLHHQQVKHVTLWFSPSQAIISKRSICMIANRSLATHRMALPLVCS